jgi:hypothetical protein
MMAKYYLLESNGNAYCADSDTVKGAWDEARQLDASYPNDAPHTVVELIPVPRPDPLAEAHARIAELEAFIAAQDAHDHYAERDEVKSLREKVAELEADATMLRDRLAQLAGAHAALLARPQGTEGRDVYEVLWHAIDMMGDAVGAMTGPGGNCIKIAEHVVARIKELEVQLAQARADEIVAVANADIWQEKLEAQLADRPQATGVVVDDAMVERFCRQFFANNGFWSGAHWMLSDKTRDDARNAMYAALTSATLVPLASAEPECWKLGTGDDTEFWRSDCGEAIPCYLGIEEVRDGE